MTRRPTHKTLYDLLDKAERVMGKPLHPTPTQASILMTAIFTMEENGVVFDDETLNEVLTPSNPLAPVYTAPGFDLFDTTLAKILTQENPNV